MQCGKCKFGVNQEMKFALMKNICPRCGFKLFTDNEMNDISLLRNRISRQSFAAEFTEELAFDFSLFVLDEIKNGLGQKYFQEMISSAGITPSELVAGETKPIGHTEYIENTEQDNSVFVPAQARPSKIKAVRPKTNETDFMRKAREEIEREFPDFQSLPEDEEANSPYGNSEDLDEKAKRLRDIARKSGGGSKQGALVRRVN